MKQEKICLCCIACQLLDGYFQIFQGLDAKVSIWKLMISSSQDLLRVIGFSREHGYTETGNYVNQVQDASHTCFGEISKT